MLDNMSKGLLRAVGLSNVSPAHRLVAIDRYAGETNLYITLRTSHAAYVKTGVRDRRIVINMLRRLLKCPAADDSIRSEIRNRLLVIKTGEPVLNPNGKKVLWRLTPDAETAVPANPVLRDTEIEAALKRFQEETHGNHAD